MIQHAVVFPYVHDIAQLLTFAEQAGVEIPPAVKQGERLTRFAVFTRHPGVAAPIRPEEFTEAIRTAEEVIRWKEGDPSTLKLCERGNWNTRMLVETVLAMLTGVCHLKKVLHRTWPVFQARLAFTLATFT